MKRLLTSAAAAAVLVAGTGSGAQAQDASASLFDLSLYGGVAYHYNWLDDLQSAGFAEDRLNPGFAPAVGAAATFWATPAFGVRTNVFYSWIDLPDGSVPGNVNGWLYDLNLMFRPWFAQADSPRLLTSLYMFIGGGGFTANPPGDGPGCVAPYAELAGACLPMEGDKASVGQGTAGIGWDIFALTPSIGLFTELAGYVYDSPFHTGPGWTGTTVAGAEDRDTYGMTGRLTAGLKFAFGERAPAVLPPPVTPPPPPPPPPAPPAPPPTRQITVCVLENGQLRNVTATFDPATGDTTVNNRRFAEAYPVTGQYAANANWFINNDSITVNDQQYVKYGLPRVIGVNEVTRAGDFRDVPLFAEAGQESPHQVLYVPVRPGCEFQPYQMRERIRVRG